MRKQELHPRTAVINKDQKNQSKKARSEALIWLAAEFPEAFDNSSRIRPLKGGIMGDILQYADRAMQAGISKSKLREAVVLFTRRLDYLICLKAREMRIDLQGNAVSEVSDEEADHASSKIKKRVEKSVRNARKIMASKNITPTNTSQKSTTYSSRATTPLAAPSAPADYLPTYPVRSNSFKAQDTPAQPKAASVIVTRKTTRQYDPDAVARLKEKLGLSRNAQEKKELVD